MRLFVIAVLVCVAAAAPKAAPRYQYNWEAYKAEYGKQYVSRTADDAHKNTYLNKVSEVNKHNQEYEQGKHTWYKGINQFSDMTSAELENSMGLIIPDNVEEMRAAYPAKPKQSTAPHNCDWRDKGAVGVIRNQHEPNWCGSCWAHAAIAALEGRQFIKDGSLSDGSQQQLVSCVDSSYDCNGCNGGWYDGAWKYIRDNAANGVDTFTSYPYTGLDSTCDTGKTSDNQDVAATCEGPGYTEKTEEAIMEAVGNDGPLAIAVNCMPWIDYSGGIYEGDECTDNPTHAVTIVGYNNDDKYWLIKNSWGTGWGEEGYLRMRKDYTSMPYGMCGLAHYAYYPLY